MPIIGVLLMTLHVAFAVHAKRRGCERSWLLIILCVPVVGCLAYLLAVVVPTRQQRHTYRQASRAAHSVMESTLKLRQYAENLAIADTVDHRMQLADELILQGFPTEAIPLYTEALCGPFRNDPQLLLGLVRAYFAAADHPQARATFERLRAAHPEYKSQDGHLLYARILEAVGDVTAACREYEALRAYYAGPEAQCRYAVLLKQYGEAEKAQTLFQEILTTAQRSTQYYNRLHKEWIALARHALG